ncbi:MAG: nitroreductase family protein [Candidatus Hodarchaeales archaeon]|jgi:hypothetical protein
MNSNKIFSFGQPKQMNAEDIKLLVSAGQLAPYIGQEQGIHILAIRSHNIINQVANHSEEYVARSSLIIASLANVQIPGSALNSVIANHQIYLLALSMHKAVAVVASFDELLLKQMLNIPEHYKITSICAIGEKGQDKAARRKSEKMENLTSLDSFGSPIS